MDTETLAAWINSSGAIIVACISGMVAIAAAAINYILSRQNQERELRALETRLRTEHKMELERLEKEQQLNFERFQREQIEQLRMGLHKKYLEAYQKFWSLLRPLSDYADPGTQLIRRETGQVFLNGPLVDSFFNSFRDFFYSEQGIFLSKAMREAVFKSRDFIMKVRQEGEQQSDGWVKISNNKAKDIEQALAWMHKNIRRDSDLEDWHLPTEGAAESAKD